MLKLTFFQLYHQRVHGFSAHYLLHSSRRDQHHGPETASHLPQLLADLCHAPLQPSASGHSSYNNVLFKVPSTGELPQKAMDRLLPFPRKIIFQIIKTEHFFWSELSFKNKQNIHDLVQSKTIKRENGGYKQIATEKKKSFKIK